MRPVLVVHLLPQLLHRQKEPVRQGLVSMTGTFIDTIVICTLTGLSIVLTGAWQVKDLRVSALRPMLFRKDFRSLLKFPHLY